MKRIIRKRFISTKKAAEDEAIRKQIEQEFPPAKTVITMEMPLAAAERLRKLFKENPEKVKADFAAMGVDLADMDFNPKP